MTKLAPSTAVTSAKAPAPAVSTTPDAGGAAATDPASEIGGRLSALRTGRKVKVSALARQVGVSPSLISQIEHGQSRPSVSTLFALSEALDVPVDAFFRDDAGRRQSARTAAADRPRPLGGVSADGPADGLRAAGPAGAGSVEAATPITGASASADMVSGASPSERGAPEPGPPEPGDRYVVRRDDRAVIDIEGGVRWERLTPARLEELEFLELVYQPHAESHATLYRHPGTEMVLVLDGRLDIFVGFERYELAEGDSMCFSSTLPHRYVNPTDQTTRAVTTILLDGGASGPPTTKSRRA